MPKNPEVPQKRPRGRPKKILQNPELNSEINTEIKGPENTADINSPKKRAVLKPAGAAEPVEELTDSTLSETARARLMELIATGLDNRGILLLLRQERLVGMNRSLSSATFAKYRAEVKARERLASVTLTDEAFRVGHAFVSESVVSHIRLARAALKHLIADGEKVIEENLGKAQLYLSMFYRSSEAVRVAMSGKSDPLISYLEQQRAEIAALEAQVRAQGMAEDEKKRLIAECHEHVAAGFRRMTEDLKAGRGISAESFVQAVNESLGIGAPVVGTVQNLAVPPVEA